MHHDINVYMGVFGAYRVPDDVVKQARAINGKRRLTDKRTRGGRYVEQWGRARDREEMLREAA